MCIGFYARETAASCSTEPGANLSATSGRGFMAVEGVQGGDGNTQYNTFG
ncbi:hypothetical protein Pa4123_81070 [Phytohabitans aurantiacus]|uniref:Uncharacterized protein n=1 Tax=Phytohabitans aurantiacus TaxID=3016789 RepID=A0ABQ5R7T8_9ACTN|nr:hypothetical protein Pa4123_81070 [Phytohabitans aurantiacus]